MPPEAGILRLLAGCTVAPSRALMGGLIGCRLTAEQVRAQLPWHQLVVLLEPETAIAEAAAAWGAATVAQLRSIPVPWEELAGPFDQPGTWPVFKDGQ